MGPLNQRVQRCWRVRTDEDVGATRRTVGAVAGQISGVRPGEIELVVTELATNLLRHTTSGGYLLYRADSDGIELLAVDQGPGGLRGPATTTTGGAGPGGRPVGLGVGLAGVARLSSTFDSYSTAAGTVILARLSASPPPPSKGGWVRWGAVSLPREGERVPGDRWGVAALHRDHHRPDDDATVVVIQDRRNHDR